MIELNFRALADERQHTGHTLRQQFDLKPLQQFRPDAGRKPALALYRETDSSRLKDYIPIRYGRMLENAFTCFRGGAFVMACDLAPLPRSGIPVQLCGDAHLGNFGLYASPERQMMFDLNDFDETLPGPFEWDLYRLITSCVIAAQVQGFADSTARRIARSALQTYRDHMADFATQSHLDVWYHHIDTDHVMEVLDQARDHMRKSVKKAQQKTSQTAVDRIATLEHGQWRFQADPPKLVPIADADLRGDLETFFSTYLESLPHDRHMLLAKYHMVDAAFRLTGTGSAGRHTYVVLLQGQHTQDTLVLQLKQAFASALEPALGASTHRHHGERVVAGQRLMQANSDIFLGWSTFRQRNCYVRQLRDRKGSIDIGDLSAEDLKEYSELCAYVLARAHARSGDSTLIAGFLGEDGAFEEAVCDFALRYAALNQSDHQALLDAEASGELEVERGI